MLRFLEASCRLKDSCDDTRCSHFCNCEAEAGREWRKHSPTCFSSCPWISCKASHWPNQPKATGEMEPTWSNLCRSAARVQRQVKTGVQCFWVDIVTIHLKKCFSLRTADSSANVYRGHTGTQMGRGSNMSLKVTDTTHRTSCLPWSYVDPTLLQGPPLEMKQEVQSILWTLLETLVIQWESNSILGWPNQPYLWDIHPTFWK